MTANHREIRILPSAEAVPESAAAEFLKAAREALREKGFYVALAGGFAEGAAATRRVQFLNVIQDICLSPQVTVG